MLFVIKLLRNDMDPNKILEIIKIIFLINHLTEIHPRPNIKKTLMCVITVKRIVEAKRRLKQNDFISEVLQFVSQKFFSENTRSLLVKLTQIH